MTFNILQEQHIEESKPFENNQIHTEIGCYIVEVVDLEQFTFIIWGYSNLKVWLHNSDYILRMLWQSLPVQNFQGLICSSCRGSLDRHCVSALGHYEE